VRRRLARDDRAEQAIVAGHADYAATGCPVAYRYRYATAM
jgi:hypothetical protein